MNDGAFLTDWSELGQWLDHQQKIIEAGYRNKFEHLKHSVEFSKIIITSLIGINSGGLVAIPAYASFFGLSGTAKASVFLVPAALFSLGLVSALLCSYFTYVNFQKWSHHAIIESNQQINSAAQLQAVLSRNLTLSDLAQKNTEAMARAYVNINAEIDASFRYGQTFGWVAAGLFITGGCVLAVNHN